MKNSFLLILHICLWQSCYICKNTKNNWEWRIENGEMKFGASQLWFEDLHYSLSDGYCVMLYAAKLMCRLICNCRASESRSKLYLVMPSPTSGIYQQDYCADGYVSTKLMCRQICNLPELNIRIFQSAYFLFFINRYEFRITDPYTLCCRIAYPPEQ